MDQVSRPEVQIAAGATVVGVTGLVLLARRLRRS
jgi:hypothetical protein